ncbi:MAG: hypothetical protein K2M60_09060 [Lachnospiraceae bacterium]|nr:hypothetical protein [Lachnospiraceae bacterium]MDE6252035.1 hypothetical protein [Lachnospiraceae bacterium]
MRITNGMMISNSLSNINNNKLKVDNLNTQLITKQKIQRPSEDPIIAVRALRLRTTHAQITQYLTRNIKDANNWMHSTDDALESIENGMKDITTYLNQAVNGELEDSDKSTIVTTLSTYRDQLFATANSDYAQRTLFTGYKTNTTLSYTKDQPDKKFNINQSFNAENIRAEKKVINGIDISKITTGTISTLDVESMANPSFESAYIMRLAYSGLDDTDEAKTLKMYTDDGSGNLTEDTLTAVTKSLNDADAYKPGDDEIHFIPETGEYVFGKNVYAKIEECERVDVSYSKTGFKKGDLDPIHYFECEDVTDPDNIVKYELKDQPIEYEVSFNQNMNINIQGKDVFQHDMTRDMDEIVDAVNYAIQSENKVNKIEEMYNNAVEDSEEKEKLEELLNMAKREYDFAKESMNQMISSGLTKYHIHQNTVMNARSDIGSRMLRLELTENRLTSQELTVKTLKSANEEINDVEVSVQFKEAKDVYDASLAVAAKLVQKRLIDFL